MQIIVLCSDDIGSFSGLFPPGFRKRSIDKAGEIPMESAVAAPATLYYSNVQFIGRIEPRTGRPGLEVLNQCVIYNGNNEEFLDSFAHFKDSTELHSLTALHLSRNSVIALSDNGIRVESGHATAIRLKKLDGEASQFEISQFGEREELHLDRIEPGTSNKS